MATEFSKNELNYARKKYYGKSHVFSENNNIFQKLINYTLTRTYYAKYTTLNIKRKIFRLFKILFLIKKKEQKKFNFYVNLNNETIQKISEELKAKDYTYTENFLPEESYQFLLNTWPDINHFNHNKKIIKHYNSGFKYDHESVPLENTFKLYPQEFGLKKFYKFLIGEKFKNFFSKLLDEEDKNFFVSTILSTMAHNDSYLIPHYDGIANDVKFKKAYNFIFFIDGYEKNLSTGGGTGIYQDNEFRKPLLMPKTIKNSILIYNTKSSNFFHGFKNIDYPKNIYRKTINFQIKI